jgi:hypothetical protein
MKTGGNIDKILRPPFILPHPLLYNILKITKESAYSNTNIHIVHAPLGFLLGDLLTIFIKNERVIFE